MRIIGLDIGDARIGAAVSDPGQITAGPLEVIDAKNPARAIERIVELAQEYEAAVIVYGLPLTMAGDEGRQSDRVTLFIDELRKSTSLPLVARDERLSTSEAEKMLIAQGVKRNKRKNIIDKIAASIILQSYLDGENAKKR